jgi:hypothetical protein
MQKIESQVRVPIHQERYDKITGVSRSDERFIVGVTGTQKGMTYEQELQLEVLLTKVHSLYSDRELWLAHGDCVGVDVEAHELAKQIGYRVCLHPPTNDKLRAYARVEPGDVVCRPQLYSICNHDIVRSCDYLIGVPRTNNEVVRSGTWATVRFARKLKKPYTIIHPNGRMDGERWKEVLIP